MTSRFAPSATDVETGSTSSGLMTRSPQPRRPKRRQWASTMPGRIALSFGLFFLVFLLLGMLRASNRGRNAGVTSKTPAVDSTNTGQPNLFTFSVVGLESLEKLGIEVTERGAEAYTFLWSAVGHLMGIREDLLPLNVADSRQVWESIKRREYSTSKEGRELTLAAIDQMKKMIPGRIGDGLAVSGMRFLLGEDTSGLLGVPPADWTRHLFVSSELFGGIFTLVNRVPVGRQLSKWVGYRIFKEFLETSRGEDRDGLFEVPEELDRLLGAKRPSWRTRMKPSIPRRAASASNRG